MTTAEAIVRGYCGCVALAATFFVSCGLWGIVCPRVHSPEDISIGLLTILWSLPIAIIAWWNALWWKEVK